MVGELPDTINSLLKDLKKAIKVNAHLFRNEWVKKRKYEENTLVINLKELDNDGTLDYVTKLDKSSNKYLPKVELISGCLIIQIKREIR